MKRQIHLNSPTGGFTLIELLVVIVIAAVLSAIAAPRWLAFLNQQRIGSARTQLTEALRNAQAEAKRTRVCQAVVVDNNSNQPRFALVSGAAVSNTDSDCAIPTNLSSVQNWQTLGNGNIRSGTMQLFTSQGTGAGTLAAAATSAVIFDSYGNVTSSSNQPPYTLTLKPMLGTNPRRCVSVTTLLGAIAENSDSQCSTIP
jgi:prepilin-type N-terminal cleavage/methylation domain-containing protein